MTSGSLEAILDLVTRIAQVESVQFGVIIKMKKKKIDHVPALS